MTRLHRQLLFLKSNHLKIVVGLKHFVTSIEGIPRQTQDLKGNHGKKQPRSRTKLPKASATQREKLDLVYRDSLNNSKELLHLATVLQKKNFESFPKIFRNIFAKFVAAGFFYEGTDVNWDSPVAKKGPILVAVLEALVNPLGSWLCTAYSTGESYNLEGLENYYTTLGRNYHIAAMPKDALDVLHVSRILEDGTEGGEVFFFRRLGAFVCWNIQGKERLDIREVVKHFQQGPYTSDLIERENEQLTYSYSEDSTDLVSGDINIKESSSEEIKALEKYAFSNALALSVKLAIWESALDDFVDSLQTIPELLKKGMKLNMSTSQVLQKTGELLSLRHQINLYSDLLMTPDFYWDRENLEYLYNKTSNYLDIGRRTKVTNEKLNMCSEMVELLRSHLHEQHSIRLEWGIIALIAIEVLFEIGHYVERLF